MLYVLPLLWLLAAASNDDAHEALRHFECSRSLYDVHCGCLTLMHLRELRARVNASGRDVWCRGYACCTPLDLALYELSLIEMKLEIQPLYYAWHLTVEEPVGYCLPNHTEVWLR